MILDLDIGNSRIKWLARSGETVAQRGVCPSIADLVARLEQRGYEPHRVRVSCVGAPAQVDELDSWLAGQGLRLCERAVTRAKSGPVRCGYQRPEQMGADRWLAVCAAWQLVKGPCVVVDAGSALTIDFLDAQAGHRGGFIVPGLALQQASLLSATESVRFEANAAVQSMAPGVNTGQAVTHGIARMLSALVEASVGDFTAELDTAVALVLTGGDAEVLGQLMQTPFRREPDLVLQGLDVVMG